MKTQCNAANSKVTEDEANNNGDEPQENALHRVVDDNANSGVSSLQSSSDAPDTTSEDAQVSSESSSYVDHSRDPRIEGHQIAPAHRRPNFPESLFAILSNESLSSAITWMPHGRSFKILNHASFSTQVLPVYYRHSNISSFLRQMSAYGFVRTKKTTINRETTYFHPRFLRGVPHLLGTIKRATTDEAKSVTEQELARISESRPLPSHLNSDDSSAIAAINASVAEELLAGRLCNITTLPIQSLGTVHRWNRGSNEATRTSSLSNDSGTNNQSSSGNQGLDQSQQKNRPSTEPSSALLQFAMSLQQPAPLNMQNATAQPSLSTQNRNPQSTAALANLLTQQMQHMSTQALQSIMLACQLALENRNAAALPHLQPAALPQPFTLLPQHAQNQSLQNIVHAYHQTLNNQALRQQPAPLPQPPTLTHGQENQTENIQALIGLLNLIATLFQAQSTNDGN